MEYKILIKDREYSDWSVYSMPQLDVVTSENIEPVKEKLFTNDIFKINENNSTTVLHSIVRESAYIPGILVLNGNNVYGSDNNKKLYKCIPDDKRIPSFLIPYTISRIGFSKNIENKYVIFKYNHWNSKHPQGVLVNSLGDVDKLEVFYEYQLYSKSLYASITSFTRATSQSLKQKTQDEFINTMIEKYKLLDRTNENVFSIDSSTTQDYDDAFSITECGDKEYKLSIYIANVPLWMNELNLWESFSERISTIYLPDRKRPMLPTVLSECLCSLCENTIRTAFSLDIEIKNGEIVNTEFNNTYIKLYKNHVYDSKQLRKDENYKRMYNVVSELSTRYKYVSKINTSYDVVSYLMILMNYYSAKKMITYNNGIYRSVKIDDKQRPNIDNLPLDVSNFVTFWRSTSGQYNLHNGEKEHDMLNLESYIHVSSPIRRLVDLLNMACIQQNLNMVDYGKSYELFYNQWTNRLDYINQTMRAIRKLQSDCSLLEMCMNNASVLECEYDGYLFDKLSRNDALYQYIVYIPSIKTMSRITTRHDMDEYTHRKFKIFVFTDEDSLKRKIRLHMLENENENDNENENEK